MKAVSDANLNNIIQKIKRMVTVVEESSATDDTIISYGTGEPTENTKGSVYLQEDTSTIVDLVYPIGSIYMSINAINPTELFGGSWERIKDKFLLSCGDTYAAGNTGGEAEHTLTVSEMPYHNHGIDTKYGSTAGDANIVMLANENTGSKYVFSNGYGMIHYQGGSEPHNNMPPYLAVYMWKRIG